MRRQEVIYAQNDGFSRNKDIQNVSTSSDICIFESPEFLMTGATKMLSGMTSGDTGIHLIETNGDPIDLIFKFSGSPLNVDTIFGYNIYKFDDKSNVFKEPYVIKSDGVVYNSFIFSNIVSDTIPSTNMCDGEYIIKPNYDYKICTDILGKLNLRNQTTSSIAVGEFNLYNETYDYYFAAIYSARKPIFDLTPQGERPLGSLNVISIIPESSGQTTFTVDNQFNGSPIVTLNGLVLAVNEDYSVTGSTITLVESTYIDDIITIIFVGAGSANGLVANSYVVTTPILEGPTDMQGDAIIYYNIGTKKFEYYLATEPISGDDIVVTINGVVLANNIDYYQSITNKKRIILEGDIFVGDVITVVYNGHATYVGAVDSNSITVYWTIDVAPQKTNGRFILQLSNSKNFSSISASATTQYIVGNRVYKANLPMYGSVGDERFYRVVNEKNYVTILDDVITSTNVSEVIPIIIRTNSLNNY